MGIAGRQIRRSAKALFTGAVLAALLTITGSSVALGADTTGAEQAGAGVTANTDIYLRDTPADIGLQPHGLNPLWQSPDIKVCHTPVECASSQNPIVGQTNYIFVTLRNPGPYGSGTGDGAVWVYRTTPGGGATWPGQWTAIGAVSLTVPAGVTTVMLPWDDVPGPGHFCLLARWVSGTDPMAVPEGPDITVNTRNNNNVVWRNVDSVNPEVGKPVTRPFAIGNSLRTTTKNDLAITAAGAPFGADMGQIVVDLGPVLFERWKAGGGAAEGVRQIGRTQLEIVDPKKASINGIVLAPGERIAFKLYFAVRTQLKQQFSVDVTQFGPDTTGAQRADLGGVRYQVGAGPVEPSPSPTSSGSVR